MFGILSESSFVLALIFAIFIGLRKLIGLMMCLGIIFAAVSAVII